jgi:hypothetical protein
MMNSPVANPENVIPVGSKKSYSLHAKNNKWDLPPFSSFPLFLIVMVKPLTDAFYEVEAVKYGYILLLMSAAFFARYGQVIQKAPVDPRNKSLLALIVMIALYFFFHFGLAIAYGGNMAEIFKIISPFVFFVLVAYAADRWLIYALAIGAVLNIIINAGLFPFNFAWVNWGGSITFKGFYFFKTDLAYSLCFSVLIFCVYSRNKFHLLWLL